MNLNQYKQKAFKEDPMLLKEYKELQPEYAIIQQVIKARMEQNMTQEELALKIGIAQSNISRLESGNYNPTISFLQKIAHGLGKELHIEIK